MNIHFESISISHLPSFVSGHTLFSQQHKKGNISEWLDLPLKTKKRWGSKASMANKKKYVDEIHKLVNSKGISQETAESLVDQSILNVVQVILSKDKESALYNYFKNCNPGLSEDRDVPLAWYSMNEREKQTWCHWFEIHPESPSSEVGNETKRVKSDALNEKSKQATISTDDSQLLEPTPTTKNIPKILIPDVVHESQLLLQQIINKFVSIEVTKDITLVKHLTENCKSWSEWLDWYTVLCSKKFSSLADLLLYIMQRIIIIKRELTELNLTNKQWFTIVSQFVTTNNEICENKLQTKLCTIIIDKNSHKFVYKNFQRTQTFTVNGNKYGQPDFVYVKNEVGELQIVKIHTLNETTRTFTGHLFTLDTPSLFPEYRTSSITNSVTYIDKGVNSKLCEFHMHDVVGKCLVLNGEDYYLGRPIDIKEDDIFCCTMVCQSIDNELYENFNLPVLKNCLKKYWGEVYYFKNDGTEKILDYDKNNKILENNSFCISDDDDESDETNGISPIVKIHNAQIINRIETTKNSNVQADFHNDVIVID